MLYGILITCLTFLVIFALSLWPILLAESKHRKYYFIGANILYLIIALYSFGEIVQAKNKLAETEAHLEKIVVISAEELTEHPENIAAAASSANEKDSDGNAKYVGEKKLQVFLSELEKNHKSAGNAAASARQGENGAVPGSEVKP